MLHDPPHVFHWRGLQVKSSGSHDHRHKTNHPGTPDDFGEHIVLPFPPEDALVVTDSGEWYLEDRNNQQILLVFKTFYWDKEEKKNLAWPRKNSARFGISDLNLPRIRFKTSCSLQNVQNCCPVSSLYQQKGHGKHESHIFVILFCFEIYFFSKLYFELFVCYLETFFFFSFEK